MGKKILTILAVVGYGLFLCNGCSPKKAVSYQELDMAVLWGDFPRTVAVLPFENHTTTEGIETDVRTSFYSHFSPKPYQDIEPSIVDIRLQKAHITDHLTLSRTPIKDLGKFIGCDAVIFGRVTQLKRVFVGIYSQLTITAVIEMWDTRTERQIWADEYTARKHEGGIPTNIIDLPLISVRTGLNLNSEAKTQLVDELCRNLVQRIPNPETVPEGIPEPPTSTVSKGSGIQPLSSEIPASTEPTTGQSPAKPLVEEADLPKPSDSTPPAEFKPEPADVTTTSENPSIQYTIQAAAFLEKDHASAYSRKLGQKGYPAWVKAGSEGSRTWYRVCVGPYSDQTVAFEIRDKIRREFRVNAFILRTQ